MVKLFFLKFFIIVSLMFISALAGMQMANNGIHNMKGYDDPNFSGALTVNEKEDGQVHASLLGEELTSHDLAGKKQKLEGIKAYNIFSEMGKKISSEMSAGLQKIINLITGKEADN